MSQFVVWLIRLSDTGELVDGARLLARGVVTAVEMVQPAHESLPLFTSLHAQLGANLGLAGLIGPQEGRRCPGRNKKLRDPDLGLMLPPPFTCRPGKEGH